MDDPTNVNGLAEFVALQIRTGYFSEAKDRIRCALEADKYFNECEDVEEVVAEEEKPFDMERFSLAAKLWREQKELALKKETA